MIPRQLLPAAMLLLLSLATGAQEPAETPEAETPAEPSAEETTASAAEEAAATKQANERFKPSEKISEDLSVSFPADI